MTTPTPKERARAWRIKNFGNINVTPKATEGMKQAFCDQIATFLTASLESSVAMVIEEAVAAEQDRVLAPFEQQQIIEQAGATTRIECKHAAEMIRFTIEAIRRPHD